MTNPPAVTQEEALAAARGKATIRLWPDAAQILGCSRNVIFEAARAGEIPTLRLGRVIRVPVPKLLAMLGETPGTDAQGTQA